MGIWAVLPAGRPNRDIGCARAVSTTQQKFCWILPKIQPLWAVCTLLIMFDRHLMQNIKTSVDEEFNILQTDVFIFCNRRLSDDIKRVQTVQRLNSILRRNPTRLYVWTNVKRTDGCLFLQYFGRPTGRTAHMIKHDPTFYVLVPVHPIEQVQS